MTNWNAYFRMIKKKFWIVILITVLFVSLASYVSLFMIKPQYKASTKLFVLINSRNDATQISYDDLMASLVLVKNYKELMKSRSITSEIIKNLQLSEVTDEELANSIDVELIPDSSMLNIVVQYENQKLVSDIANELSYVFIKKTSELLKMNNISLVDKAIVTEKPVYPRQLLVISLSFLFGIVLSLGIILALVYFDDTVGIPEEIEKKTGLRVIGIVPDMKIR